jgi:hypothetical protein
MNVYFLSLLKAEIPRREKQTKCYLVPWIDDPSNVKKNYPNLKKGDVVMVRFKYHFWDGSSLVESEVLYDSQGIPCTYISPFLVTDTKFSPDYWSDDYIHFRFSKVIRKRITQNFDPITKTSRFRVGKKKWILRQQWWYGNCPPFNKSTIFRIGDENEIVSFNYEPQLFPIDRFLSDLWKMVKKWYKYQGG